MSHWLESSLAKSELSTYRQYTAKSSSRVFRRCIRQRVCLATGVRNQSSLVATEPAQTARCKNSHVNARFWLANRPRWGILTTPRQWKFRWQQSLRALATARERAAGGQRRQRHHAASGRSTAADGFLTGAEQPAVRRRLGGRSDISINIDAAAAGRNATR